jgi:pyrroloquinoline quinone biosynthesis protein B
VSANGRNWYLVNATPDVRFQIESFSALHPGPGPRETPLQGVLLTDAEVDHTLGLLILREGTPLDIYGSAAIIASLRGQFPIRRIIQSYTEFHWHEVRPDKSFLLDGDRLQARAFRAGVKSPRYCSGLHLSGDWVVAYRFEDLKTNGVAVYAPAIENWNHALAAELDNAACAFLDGTFWSDDEMIQAGVGQVTALEMGHLPIAGANGSLEHLSGLRLKRKIYIHINNTNPILDEGSPERRFLDRLGIEVGWDGMDVEV